MGKRLEKILMEQREQLIDILRTTVFDQFDTSIHHQQVIPVATYAPWESDVAFNNVYEKAKKNTLVDKYRCYELWRMVNELNLLSGDILEVGVWRGGTGAILSKASEPNKETKIYLADTFEGVVKATENDTVYRGGEHSDTSSAIVEELLKSTGSTNFTILKGIFPDDFPKVKIETLKLCHIDVDTYMSAKEVFDYAWPKIIVGGIVVFDDYGFWTCEGVTKYFNDLKLSNGTKIHNLNGHGIIIKTNSN
jgi:O-methyltransferase